jgi:outer membrane protein assembly factor BamB/predicted Ser/Thr protein kinase
MNELSALKIGRFQIERGIGQGGMGIVYRAHDTVLERPVALKLLGEHLQGNQQAFTRFRREAEMLMRLKHSNIALVYDFGEHQGRPYIAMEWVEGRTLKALLQQEKRLPLARSLAIIKQLAAALDYAHLHGVVHRDIKPANILIDQQDHVTIVDFGVAWWDEAPSLTTTGTIVGTPLYMSPEQLLGKTLDGRSDLYSLGIIFYEMLAGRPPFGGEAANTPAVIQQQLYLPPPPLLELAPATPQTVSDAIEKVLNKMPEERFASGEAFVRALNQGPGAAIKPANRTRTILKIVLVSLVLLGLAWLALGLLSGQTPDEAEVAVVTPAPVQALASMPAPTSTPEIDEGPLVPMASPDGGAWTGLHGNAGQLRYQEQLFYPLAAEPRWHFEAQQALEQSLVAANGRIFVPEGERIQILEWDTGLLDTAPRLGAPIVAPLALLDAEQFRLFAATEDQQLYALDGYDMTLYWRIGGASEQDAVIQQTAGPDGVLYAAIADGQLVGIDDQGEIVFVLTLEDKAILVQPIAVTATGIYGITNQYALVVVDPRSGQLVWQQTLNDRPTTPALPLEDFGVVVAGLENGQIQGMSVLSGEPRWQQSLGNSITGFAYDYEHLFVATSSGMLYALNPDDGTVFWQQSSGDALLFAPIALEKRILTLSEVGRMQLFDAETGQELEEMALDLNLEPTQPPVMLGGWLFVQDADGLWAYGPAQEEMP